MGNACGAQGQSNCLQRLKQEFREVSNRILVLQRKIEALNRKNMVHEAYIKNSELSGLQEQQKQLANAIALVTKIQQQQANANRQVFIITTIDNAQKEILRLDLKNTNLNNLFQDQQKIEYTLKKMEETLSQFNDGIGSQQLLKTGQSSENQEQSFLEKIQSAFNRFESVIESLKRKLFTQEERSNLLSNLFEQERHEKKQLIDQYKIQIENFQENKLRVAEEQIQNLENNLKETQQMLTEKLDEQMKQNLKLEEKNIMITEEKLELLHQLSEKNSQFESFAIKMNELENEKNNAESKFGYLNNQCTVAQCQLRSLQKQYIELQSQLEKQRNSSQATIQILQNEKNQKENQIEQLTLIINQNQYQEENNRSINNCRQLEENNKRLEKQLKEYQKEIDNLNIQIIQLHDNMILQGNEKQNYENKEKEIAHLLIGKDKSNTDNIDFFNSVQENKCYQPQQTQMPKDQYPFQQAKATNRNFRGNSVTSFQNQAQYRDKSPQSFSLSQLPGRKK